MDTVGAVYRLRAPLPAPLPPLSTDVELGGGTVDLERLRPLSLGLKLHGGRRVRVAVSAGLSWLPGVRFTLDQAIGVRVTGLGGSPIPLDLAQVGLTAEALPSEEGQGRLGGHAGLSLGFPLGRRLSLVAEGRYFRFQEQTLHWSRSQTTAVLPAIQENLVREIESRLEPVAFNPTFFHASVGLALRF